ncbi:hypothetical protein ACPPVO_16895 [Dactylosporangium sp. McL0621]|uniref:hypothetical protein n=1 Tax=Dactylosporangium sp. McL0621 TaxID=3415678 RepID=UPI003CF6B0E7
MNRRVLAVSFLLVPAVLALAGCGGSDNKHPRPSAHRSTAPAKTPPARPTAGPPIAMGQSARLLDTVNATVYEFRQPSVTGGPTAGPPGYSWASADVQVCTLDSAKQNVTVDWKTWGLHYADNSIAVAAETNNDAFPRPEYPFTSRPLANGTCVRGWITFSAPTGQRPTTVDYSPHGAVASWIVPAGAAPSAS